MLRYRRNKTFTPYEGYPPKAIVCKLSTLSLQCAVEGGEWVRWWWGYGVIKTIPWLQEVFFSSSHFKAVFYKYIYMKFNMTNFMTKHTPLVHRFTGVCVCVCGGAKLATGGVPVYCTKLPYICLHMASQNLIPSHCKLHFLLLSKSLTDKSIHATCFNWRSYF